MTAPPSRTPILNDRTMDASENQASLFSKSPPHHIQAERSLLGLLLIQHHHWHAAAEKLSPEDFYLERHRGIWWAMQRAMDAGDPLDPITVSSHLGSHLERAGGIAYLAGLADDLHTATPAPWIKIIQDCAMRRRLLATSLEIAESIWEAKSATDCLDQAESQILKVRSQKREGIPTSQDAVQSAFAWLEAACQGKVPTIKTGVPKLDKCLMIQAPDLVILAARPSVGKTALALQITRVQCQADMGVLFISLEMSKEQLALRLTAAEARINISHKLKAIQEGYHFDQVFPGDTMSHMTSAATRIARWPLWIDDKCDGTLPEIKAKIRRAVHDWGVGLVIIDYLQLAVGDPSSRYDNRAHEVGDISRQLKLLAKNEVQIPIIVLCQLNRESVKNREPRHPRMSDLRESGNLEQDADIVLLLHEGEEGLEVCIDKQRSFGAHDWMPVHYAKGIQHFFDYPGDMEDSSCH